MAALHYRKGVQCSQQHSNLTKFLLAVKNKVECTQAINRCKTKDGEQGREQGSSQGTETQRNWISPELLEAIESIPYHEYFIHMHDGVLPCG